MGQRCNGPTKASCSGARKHGESSVILELMTRDARPPSRPRAWRALAAAAAGAAARQQRAGASGARGSTSISAATGRGAASCARRGSSARRWRSTASAPLARSCGCCPSAIRIRRSTRRSRCWSSISTSRDIAPALVRALRDGDAGRVRLRPRSRALRRDRRGATISIYVSPKSGRAVSAEAGEPYKDRLLRCRLPDGRDTV